MTRFKDGITRVSHEAQWAAEAIRLHRRYEREVVEECGLCPWASRARREGRIQEDVLLQAETISVGPSLAAIDALRDDADLALLLYPKIYLGRAAFTQFASRVRDADLARRSSRAGPFVLAVFHPDAQPDVAEPERLVPFLRRTPDPTIQLLRTAFLERVRGPTSEGTRLVDPSDELALEPPRPSVRECIARANWETTLRLGVDIVARRLDDIVQDRERTYRHLRGDER